MTYSQPNNLSNETPIIGFMQITPGDCYDLVGVHGVLPLIVVWLLSPQRKERCSIIE